MVIRIFGLLVLGRLLLCGLCQRSHTHSLAYTPICTHPRTQTRHTLGKGEERPTSCILLCALLCLPAGCPARLLADPCRSFPLAYVNFCASLIACHMAADARRMLLASCLLSAAFGPFELSEPPSLLLLPGLFAEIELLDGPRVSPYALGLSAKHIAMRNVSRTGRKRWH